MDDDPQLLSTLVECLDGQGYALITAAEGRRAMEILKAQEFDLALLDLILPDVSGFDLLSYIKTNHPDTEVILITGHAGLDSAVQALRLGAYDYLKKSDLRLAELQALVTRALERRRLARQNRELVNHLTQAREELATRRARELAQVRQIGETLVGPLTWSQLSQGLVNLIWNSFPVQLLGLAIYGPIPDLPLENFRRRPEIPNRVYQTFQKVLTGLVKIDPKALGLPLAETPLPEMLWQKVTVEDVILVAGAGRQEPFTPEETELFRIFILQGEAGIKNLSLFERVKSMAVRDGLTGLHNYRYFRETLLYEVERSRRYNTPLSLLFLDIDNFKQINDTMGHLYGDTVIREVGRILKGGIRLADLLCRYGGDEFVLLMTQTPLEQAELLAERLRRLIAESLLTRASQDCRVTVSIGVAGLVPGMSMEGLIQTADDALYRAKQSGKNQSCGPKAGNLAEEKTA